MWIQVRLCINENIPVVPVPGPSAVVAAISASGLSTDEFTFGKFRTGTYSCALTVRASFFELFLPYGLPLGSLQLLNMCNVQLDLFLSMLHLEERGWWFQQMRRQLKYSMFLRTNSSSFLRKLYHYLVNQGISYMSISNLLYWYFSQSNLSFQFQFHYLLQSI